MMSYRPPKYTKIQTPQAALANPTPGGDEDSKKRDEDSKKGDDFYDAEQHTYTYSVVNVKHKKEANTRISEVVWVRGKKMKFKKLRHLNI